MNRKHLVLACVLFASCGDSEPAIEMASAQSGLRLVDVTESAGLAGFTQENGNRQKAHIPESVGAGVGFVDYDQDGDLDIYLTNGSSMEGFAAGEEPRDALYRNEGDGSFRDVTAEAGLGDIGWTCGVSVVDVDGDGWPDVYLSNFGPNVMYRNQGDGTFADITASAGVGDPRYSTCGGFFDYDGDGDLDLYVSNYVDFDPDFKPEDESTCNYRGVMTMYGPRGLEGSRDRLYRNDGNLRFTDVTAAAGIEDPGAYGFQVIAFDYDTDGDQDLFVANDSTANFLWRNEGDGTFRESAYEAGTALSESGREQSGMGACLGDADGDGRLDVFVTNFSEDHCTLYRNDGGGLFSDATYPANLGRATFATLGWGCAFEDFDNDGHVDLYVANGHVYPQVDQFDFGIRYRQANQLFAGRADGRFEELTAPALPAEDSARCSRGAAFGDYDNDGDIDVLVGNLDDRPTLLRNDSAPLGSWVKVLLIGTESHRDAIGATIRVETQGRSQLRAAGTCSSFLSANDPRAHFGLGTAQRVDAIEVRWPNGKTQRFEDLPVECLLRIEEGSALVEEVRL